MFRKACFVGTVLPFRPAFSADRGFVPRRPSRLYTTSDSFQKPNPGFADKDGHFRRKESAFRDQISSDPTSAFPAESGRYALYIHKGCPWAHRTYITRALKGLEDVIQLIVLDDAEKKDGKMLWCFSGEKRDPLYGFKYLKELYEKSEPGYDGRYLVPTLWDKKTGSWAV
jgi:putative glutathione S-transferase